ncbi:hypothetical protein AVEN_214678-1 [Araneus ventricosus]|uniref:Uncharacterized protein n=1 Tax=Araneus ventricosus TaxID=182803 RepID=A0A4Y2K8R3_ARAVE|nr:hypothetical protein AVEN_214678-1 [Araneus ventricosus]
MTRAFQQGHSLVKEDGASDIASILKERNHPANRKTNDLDLKLFFQQRIVLNPSALSPIPLSNDAGLGTSKETTGISYLQNCAAESSLESKHSLHPENKIPPASKANRLEGKEGKVEYPYTYQCWQRQKEGMER